MKPLGFVLKNTKTGELVQALIRPHKKNPNVAAGLLVFPSAKAATDYLDGWEADMPLSLRIKGPFKDIEPVQWDGVIPPAPSPENRGGR